MTDTLIARLRDATTGNLCADRVEAADRIEYQDKLIEQFGGISKDAMEQCFALTKERDQLRAEVERLKGLIALKDTTITFNQTTILTLQARLTALESDKEVLLGHMDTINRCSNDPAIFNLSKVVIERFAAGAAPTKEQT